MSIKVVYIYQPTQVVLKVQTFIFCTKLKILPALSYANLILFSHNLNLPN